MAALLENGDSTKSVLDHKSVQSYCPRQLIRGLTRTFMHTIMVTAGGFALLGLFVLLVRFWSAERGILSVAANSFIPVWLAITLLNLWIGVQYAGYTLLQELPILAVTFGLPAAAAVLINMRAQRGRRL